MNLKEFVFDYKQGDIIQYKKQCRYWDRQYYVVTEDCLKESRIVCVINCRTGNPDIIHKYRIYKMKRTLRSKLYGHYHPNAVGD